MKTKEPRTNCIVCEKPIFRGNSQSKANRGNNAKTCSSKCSKVYSRIYKEIYWRLKEKL